MALTRKERRQRIKLRIRTKIAGTTSVPRLSVFRSNKQIYVQIVDDSKGTTLVMASSREESIASQQDVNKTKQAELVGTLIADKCKDAGISDVVSDRNGYLYHGRIKSLAEAARKNGLKF